MLITLKDSLGNVSDSLDRVALALDRLAGIAEAGLQRSPLVLCIGVACFLVLVLVALIKR